MKNILGIHAYKIITFIQGCGILLNSKEVVHNVLKNSDPDKFCRLTRKQLPSLRPITLLKKPSMTSSFL